MATKALVYVPEINIDAFKDSAREHGVKLTFFAVDVMDNYIYEAEGDELNNEEWIDELKENLIEVSVYSEILELL